MKSSKIEIMSREHKIPEIRFEDQRLTSFAGLVVFQGLFKPLAIKQKLQNCFSHLKISPIFGHHLIVLCLIVHLLLGYRKLRDMDYYRDDPMVKRLLGVTRLPDVSTVSRALARVDQQSVEKIRQLCRGWVGGVTRRFPGLCFGFLEGGVAWACTLLADLVGPWEKRNANAILALDPARIDVALLLRLVDEYGDERFRKRQDALESAFGKLEPEPPTLDEWAACGIARAEDIRDLFVPRFYFGCEADDPTVAWAFDAKVNPMGSRLRAMFSSDIGHWDVPEMGEVVAEAHELVLRGLLSEADFRDFVFANPVRFYTSANPDFFRGTRCEAAAERILAERS